MLRIFEIAIVQAKIAYNSYGCHNQECCFFVLKEELERYGGPDVYIHKADRQEIRAEPLVIRANTGDYIDLHITDLTAYSGDDTDIMHSEVLIRRFYAGNEPGTILLHNYLFESLHQYYGLYGALVIEEYGTTFYNPHNNKKLRFGTRAVIRCRNGTSFREFILFVHNCHSGAMGINYCTEPVTERLERVKNPAYIFSSFLHGDPATPILETYPGDEIRIHLLDVTNTGYNSLNIPGIPVCMNKSILKITDNYSAGDYLYYLGKPDGKLDFLWGIVRVHKKYKKDLMPLYSEKEHVLPEFISPGNGSIIRHYEIAAADTRIIHGKYKNYVFGNTGRMVFVLLKDLEMVLAGKTRPEPLTLYANSGEWIEIILYNAFNTRISLNPQSLQYEPLHNSGINVGYNEWEQTVAPGESRRYLWYAGKNYKASCRLYSFGDMENSQYCGLAGTVISE